MNEVMYYFLCYSDILFILGTCHTITPDLITVYLEELFTSFLLIFTSNGTNNTTAAHNANGDGAADDAIKGIGTNNMDRSTDTSIESKGIMKQLNTYYNVNNILHSHEIIDNFLYNNVGIWDKSVPELPIVEYHIEQTEMEIITLDKHAKAMSYNKLDSMDDGHRQQDGKEEEEVSLLSELTLTDTLTTVQSEVFIKFYCLDNNNNILKQLMVAKNNLDELFLKESMEKETLLETQHTWVRSVYTSYCYHFQFLVHCYLCCCCCYNYIILVVIMIGV